jgi:hypothetical protein
MGCHWLVFIDRDRYCRAIHHLALANQKRSGTKEKTAVCKRFHCQQHGLIANYGGKKPN